MQGTTALYTVTVTPINGFSGPVALSASGYPAGTTATNPSSVTGSGTATLTLTTAVTLQLELQQSQSGEPGALTRTAETSLVVTAAPIPAFTMTALPRTRLLTQGQTTSYDVAVMAQNGFSGTVSFGVAGLPSGASAVFSPSTTVGGGTTTMTVTTAVGTPIGSSTLTIQAASGTLARSAAVALVVNAVPDFTFTATPASASAVQAGGASYTIAVGSLGGFSGPVALSVSGLPPGASASFTPVAVSPGSTSTLTISTSSTTPLDTSALQIVGTSGALSHETSASLTVTARTTARAIGIDFVGAGTAMNATETAGVVPQANWNSATGSSQSTGLSLVDDTVAPTSATVVWSANSASATSISDQAGNRRMMRGHLNTTSSTVSTVTVSGLADATYDVYVYVDGDNGSSSRTASYRISGAGISTATINLTDAANTNFSGSFIQASGSNGNYVKFRISASGFTVTGTPSGSFGTRRAPINGVQIVPALPDLAVAISPGAGTVLQGDRIWDNVNTTALNGFAGSAALKVNGLPPGVTEHSRRPPSPVPAVRTLTLTAAADSPTGTSTFSVTATSGSLARTAAASLTVSTPGRSPGLRAHGIPIQPHRAAKHGRPVTSSPLPQLPGSPGKSRSRPADCPGMQVRHSRRHRSTGLERRRWSRHNVHDDASGSFDGNDHRQRRRNDAVHIRSVDGDQSHVFAIGGAITPAAVGSAATVTLGGASAATATANADGTFSFSATRRRQLRSQSHERGRRLFSVEPNGDAQRHERRRHQLYGVRNGEHDRHQLPCQRRGSGLVVCAERNRVSLDCRRAIPGRRRERRSGGYQRAIHGYCDHGARNTR